MKVSLESSLALPSADAASASMFGYDKKFTIGIGQELVNRRSSRQVGYQSRQSARQSVQGTLHSYFSKLYMYELNNLCAAWGGMSRACREGFVRKLGVLSGAPGLTARTSLVGQPRL